MVAGKLLVERKREKARLGTKDHTHGFLFTSLNRLYTKHTHTGIATRISISQSWIGKSQECLRVNGKSGVIVKCSSGHRRFFSPCSCSDSAHMLYWLYSLFTTVRICKLTFSVKDGHFTWRCSRGDSYWFINLGWAMLCFLSCDAAHATDHRCVFMLNIHFYILMRSSVITAQFQCSSHAHPP